MSFSSMAGPTGAIPRIERQQSHYRFVWAVRPLYAMVNLDHAARIVMSDRQFFPPETDVILTSTISDDALAAYTFEDELRIVRQFKPDYYLPFDLPVYADMKRNRRTEFIEQVAISTRHMHQLMQPLSDREVMEFTEQLNISRELVVGVQNTTIIPLIKGTNPTERRTMLGVAQDISSPCIAKYGAQYMTVGGSGNYPQLNKVLHSIHTESDGYPMLVIGLLSPCGKYSLEHTPPSVVAGAGLNQWRKRISPQSDSPNDYRNAFAELFDDVCEALNVNSEYHTSIAQATPDTPPEQFQSKRGYEVTEELMPSLSGIAGSSEYGFGQRKRPESALTASMAGKKGGSQSPKE